MIRSLDLPLIKYLVPYLSSRVTVIKVSSKPRNDVQFSTYDGITRSLVRFVLTCNQKENEKCWKRGILNFSREGEKRMSKFNHIYFINLLLFEIIASHKMVFFSTDPKVLPIYSPALKLFYLRNSG